jgi:hypothetical protein
MEFWAECKEINRKLFCEFWVVELNRFKLNLNYFKPKFLDFSKIKIWTLIQRFKSNKFELKV